jgi:cell division protein FtsW
MFLKRKSADSSPKAPPKAASKLSAKFSKKSSAPACPWPLPPQGIDLVLLFTVVGMVLFGLLMVYSSSFIYAQERTGDGFAFIKKQLLFSGLGFGALIGVCRIDYRKWYQWAYPVLATAILLLAAVFIPGLGTKALGAQRWLHLGPLNFQPGELAKFAVIIFVAHQLEKKKDRLHTLAAGVFSHFLLPLPAFLLLLLQPDFGTTVIICTVIFALMFLAGVPKKYLFTAFILAAIAGVFLAFGSAYRRDRVMTFIDPWRDPSGKGFQIIQSLLGLHNGALSGVGLGNGKEKLFFLPEAHNDFIFAVIGEELGFLGIIGVILVYMHFIYRGLRIGWNCHTQYQDLFGMLLATGITLALGIQGFVNMAVVMGLVPTKGLTLPFISYGGSAILVDLVAIGILLSVARGPQLSTKIPDSSALGAS